MEESANENNQNNNLVKKKEGIKNELTVFTVNMLNLYSQNERSGNADEDITMHKIKTRHLLIYYLYRVFCKYRDYIMNVISVEEINNLYKLLNIPETSRGCMPMAGRMSNKKDQLDTVLFSLIKVFNDFNMKQKGLVSEDKFNEMLAFFKSKENPKKILEDIKVLNILIPDLSTSNIEYNVFDKSSKRAALLDLGIEPSNDDVSLSAPPETTLPETTPPLGSNTDLDTSSTNNNQLEKELENAETKEFDASEIAVQQDSSISPPEDLPEVSSLGNNNQNIPDIGMSETPPPPTPSPSPMSEMPPSPTPSPSPMSEMPPSPTPMSETPPPPEEPQNNDDSLFNNEGNVGNEINKL
jgi:hypothetical protein